MCIRDRQIELRRSSDNLEQYVNVEGVTTKTGTRNIEVDAESTPFDNVDEAADFPEMDEPEFLPNEYKVKQKGDVYKRQGTDPCVWHVIHWQSTGEVQETGNSRQILSHAWHLGKTASLRKNI